MDNELFKMISEAAFCNPFTERRAAIDRKIVGDDSSPDWASMQQPLLEKLERAVGALQKESGFSVAALPKDDDGTSIRISILFHIYHQYSKRFDELIEKQIKAGDESLEAAFALQCFNDLKGFGFNRNDACRYVAVFYQVRRAYYFISKALIGNSPCMRAFRAQLWNNIFTHEISWYERALWNRMEDFSTLMLGETGGGKGAAAAAVGRSGFIPFNTSAQKFEESFMRAFVSINLSQFPESLIESELFGHCKGAFTGATEKHDGIFARCSSHGAIFLDEIGDVSIPVQIKLLQVLQDRTFTPVGSHDKIRFSGRVIAATNKPVDQLRKEGKFRDDFYYRLCSDIVTVPPLRQRIREMPSELELLASFLLKRICGPGLQLPVVERLKESVDKNYAWPGNVRELEQAIRRIMITGTYEQADNTSPMPSVTESGELTARQLVEKYCRDLYEVYGNYGEVARRTGLDWRTVKKNVGL